MLRRTDTTDRWPTLEGIQGDQRTYRYPSQRSAGHRSVSTAFARGLHMDEWRHGDERTTRTWVEPARDRRGPGRGARICRERRREDRGLQPHRFTPARQLRLAGIRG